MNKNTKVYIKINKCKQYANKLQTLCKQYVHLLATVRTNENKTYM